MKKIILLLFLGIIFTSNAQEEDPIKKAKESKKYDLKVFLTTGKSMAFNSSFTIDFCNRVMFLTDTNELPIYPQNTISIERTLKDGTILKGYPTDSLWLFKTIDGKISGYATKPETKLKFVEYLSHNNETMVDFQLETLRSMLSDNQEALGLFYKHESQKKIAKNIFATSFLVGLAHVYAPSPIKKEVTYSNGETYKEDVMFYPQVALGGILGAAYLNNKSKKKSC